MKNNIQIKIDANKEYGFNFPFLLILPEKLRENPDLIVACTLPHDFIDSSKSFEEVIEKTCTDFSSIDPMHKHLSLESGNPLFIPCIPKIKELRPGFLGKNLHNNDFSATLSMIKNNKTCITNENIYQYYNLADQYKNMIQYAIKYLKDKKINVNDKVIMSGYSEGAKFSSHFSLLHPEIISAIVSGGTGGCISMPIAQLNGYEFSYPTGISDIKGFDMNSFQKINFFYYIGTEDKTDSAIPNFQTSYYLDENGKKQRLVDECGNDMPPIDAEGNRIFIMDNHGNYTAKFSLFSDSEVNSINKALGTISQERFIKQYEIYKNLGLNCEFKMYLGNHRTIFDNRQQIFNDVDFFLNKSKQNIQQDSPNYFTKNA